MAAAVLQDFSATSVSSRFGIVVTKGLEPAVRSPWPAEGGLSSVIAGKSTLFSMNPFPPASYGRSRPRNRGLEK